MRAFESLEDLGTDGRMTEYESKLFVGRCHQRWFPASLINTFVAGFEYKGSTWTVLENAVTAVSDSLSSAGFSHFYKDAQTFDVKPLPIHSDERQEFFGLNFVRQHQPKKFRNWQSVRKNLVNDVAFMETA